MKLFFNTATHQLGRAILFGVLFLGNEAGDARITVFGGGFRGRGDNSESRMAREVMQ